MNGSIASVEQTVFDEEKVHAPTFQNYLRAQNLALVVNRNSTRRDAADKQQPYNLKVAWSNTQTLGIGGKIYDIGWVQIMQADAIRAFTQSSNPRPRRSQAAATCQCLCTMRSARCRQCRAHRVAR